MSREFNGIVRSVGNGRTGGYKRGARGYEYYFQWFTYDGAYFTSLTWTLFVVEVFGRFLIDRLCANGVRNGFNGRD